MTFTTPANLIKDLGAGHYDAVAGARPSLTQLYKDGKLQRGMRAKLARTGIGITIKAGAPKPDLSNEAAFKKAVMKARNVLYTDPNIANASGSVTHRILVKAKLLDAVNAKGKETALAPGRELIAKGDYEMGFFNISEATAPGVVLAGPVPKPLQQYTNYDIAVLKDAAAKKDAQAFVKFVSSNEAGARWKSSGMEPYVPRAKAKKS
jgi:molybdate transport system substrate-binding protein